MRCRTFYLMLWLLTCFDEHLKSWSRAFFLMSDVTWYENTLNLNTEEIKNLQKVSTKEKKKNIDEVKFWSKKKTRFPLFSYCSQIVPKISIRLNELREEWNLFFHSFQSMSIIIICTEPKKFTNEHRRYSKYPKQLIPIK